MNKTKGDKQFNSENFYFLFGSTFLVEKNHN